MRVYTNLSIRMRDFDGQRFAVEVTDSPVGRMREPDYVMFDWGVLPLLQKHDELNDEKQEDLSLRDLRELGEMLGGMLLPPAVREAFRKSIVWVKRQETLASLSDHRDAVEGEARAEREEPSLRIVLDIDDTRLMSLPWEYAYMWEYGKLASEYRSTSTEVTGILSSAYTDRTKKDKIEGIREKSQLDGFLIRDPRISMVRLEPFIVDPDEAPYVGLSSKAVGQMPGDKASGPKPLPRLCIGIADPADMEQVYDVTLQAAVIDAFHREEVNFSSYEYDAKHPDEPGPPIDWANKGDRLERGSDKSVMFRRRLRDLGKRWLLPVNRKDPKGWKALVLDFLSLESMEETSTSLVFDVFHYAGHGGVIEPSMVEEVPRARGCSRWWRR